jgi:hypothetical protein
MSNGSPFIARRIDYEKRGAFDRPWGERNALMLF